MDPEPPDATRCPLCGESNGCGMAAGSDTCWCFDATIPKAVLDAVPADAKGKLCVCEKCAGGVKPVRRANLPVG